MALGDLFCWPDESGSKHGSPTGGTAAPRLERPRLVRRGVRYPCAAIQMTMSVAPLPPTGRGGAGAVFGVGINDCEARIVEVPSLESLLAEVGPEV